MLVKAKNGLVLWVNTRNINNIKIVHVKGYIRVAYEKFGKKSKVYPSF